MRKLFLFAVMVLAFVGCNINTPERNELLGTWSEPYQHPYENIDAKTFTFNENDTLIYTERYIIIDEAPKEAKLHYSIKNHKLHISGERIAFDDSTSKFVYEPFTFSTGYSVEGNMLTIDSFSYNGYSTYHKPVIVYKQ